MSDELTVVRVLRLLRGYSVSNQQRSCHQLMYDLFLFIHKPPYMRIS